MVSCYDNTMFDMLQNPSSDSDDDNVLSSWCRRITTPILTSDRKQPGNLIILRTFVWCVSGWCSAISVVYIFYGVGNASVHGNRCLAGQRLRAQTPQ